MSAYINFWCQKWSFENLRYPWFTTKVDLFIYYNAFIGVPLYKLNLSNSQSSVHKNSGLRILVRRQLNELSLFSITYNNVEKSELGEQEGFQLFFNCIWADKQSGRTNCLRHIVPQSRSCIGESPFLHCHSSGSWNFEQETTCHGGSRLSTVGDCGE